MSAILLTWNPKKWKWHYLDSCVTVVSIRGYVDEPWSVSNRKRIPVGTRVFLMKLGSSLSRDQKGLIASGLTRTEPKLDGHWNEEQCAQGRQANYIDVRFDYLASEPVIDLDELEEGFREVTWTPQSSGNSIPTETFLSLEQEWIRRTDSGESFSQADELRPAESFVEGGTRFVIVNAFERDERARTVCLEHYGTSCAVCSMSFGDVYGELAVGYIHVHHLTPLSQVAEAHKVDPVQDLRPVCPNCHAVIHLSSPPLSIEDARRLLRHPYDG